MTYLLPQTPSGGGITLQGAWKFSTNTAATDPGNKTFKINTGSLASATNIYISETTDNNADASNILGVLAQGNRIYMQQQDDASRAALFEISGAPVDNGSWWTIPVTVVSSLTIWQNNRTCAAVLDLSAAGGAGGGAITVDAVQDMTSIAIVNTGTFAAGTKGFRADFWDADINSLSRSITCRLIDGGGLHTTGYNYQRWDKDFNAAAYVAGGELTVTAATWLDPQSVAAFDLVWGYWEGRLMDAATNLWSMHGVFRDNVTTIGTKVEVFGQVALDSPAEGARFQSGNGLNWDAGMMSSQHWT